MEQFASRLTEGVRMENVQQSELPSPAGTPEERGRSTVEFPYFDLDSAVEIARAVRDVGVTSCDPASLAAKLNMAPDGGGFRMRLIAAKTFSAVNYGRSVGGNVELTDTGRLLVDAEAERRGRLDSFMSIPLYKALFDRLKGQVLPPASALDRLIESMGVAPKQKEKARQVFLRSAKQAGLLDLAPDRLTPPAGLTNGPTATPQPTAPPHADQQPQRRGSTSGVGHLHPFIEGLIGKLPPPDAEWDMVSRAKWLNTAANIFDLMYRAESQQGIAVSLKGTTLLITTEGLV